MGSMLAAIGQGFFLAMILALMIGPLFLALMSITISEGRIKGFFFCTGIILSDLTFALLAYHSVKFLNFSLSSIGAFTLGAIGGMLFLAFGTHLLYKKEKPSDVALSSGKEKRKRGGGRVLLEGFLMNSANPSVILFWMAAIKHFGSYIAHHHLHTQASHMTLTHTFIATAIIVFYATDIIKVFFADWIIQKLTLKNLDKLHKIGGAILILAGLFVIIRSFIKFF